MSAELGFNKETTSEQVGEAFASNIQGKVVLVTGCSPKSLGAETARIAAKYGASLVILAGRRQSALEETAADIKKEMPNANLRLLIVDLSSLASVRAAANQVLAYDEAIDVLVNNAGIMAVPHAKTVDGFESQLGTNYIGPFVFTNTILPKLFETSAPRIVNLTSSGHYLSPFRFEDPMFDNDYNPWIVYGQSKTAFMLYAKELTRRYHASHHLSAFSVHPGVISTTNLNSNATYEGNAVDTILTYKGEKFFYLPKVALYNNWKDIPQGTSTQLVAAFDPSIVNQSGSYLCDAQVCNEAAEDYALDDDNAVKLWKWTEEIVGQTF
ncbi:putative short-chain dehydrogenase [Gongronella butleri]|nr:putative short-chain dehydrogenase [Gongronella butleri]